MQKRRRQPLCVKDRAQIKGTIDRLEKQQNKDKHDRHTHNVETHRKHICSAIIYYEDAVAAHTDYLARQTRLERELAEARLDSEAALAHCAVMKKMSWGSVDE